MNTLNILLSLIVNVIGTATSADLWASAWNSGLLFWVIILASIIVGLMILHYVGLIVTKHHRWIVFIQTCVNIGLGYWVWKLAKV